jgi:DNA-binding MarR family transcriptional regulator
MALLARLGNVNMPVDGSKLPGCNCLSLRQAARHVSQIYDSHLAATGLRTTQFSILAKLRQMGPQTIHALAKSMVMDRTTLGRAIRPLERDGLLAVEAGEDARTRNLKLTASGKARLKTAEGKWKDAQKEFERAFGSEQAADLRAILERVVTSSMAP